MQLRSAEAWPGSGVEVVVPSYNHARYVERCIRSVFEQTHAPARLLVIDDGSRDDSPRVIERVLRDAPFPAELVVRANRGLCATLNEGLERTTAEYFAYLGSDDSWHPERLGAGVEALRDRPECVAAYSHCFVVDDDDRVTGSTEDWAGYVGGDMLPLFLRGESVPMSPTVLYRREALQRIGWREGSPLEDYELYLQLAAAGPFAFVARPLAYWRKHASNTSSDIGMMHRNFVEAHRRVAPALGLDERALKQLEVVAAYRHAGYYLMAGDRARAIRLTVPNLAGAPSVASALRRLATLALPRRVLERRRARLERQAAERQREGAGSSSQ